MPKVIAVLATLDTKGEQAGYLREQLERLGSQALIVDLGVTGTPELPGDVTREEVARTGGTALADLVRNPSREAAQPVMARGALRVLQDRLAAGTLHGVIGLGGLQGTAVCTEVMRALPYGLPKIMVSTVASGNTAAYVDVMDITMMFSVADIIGLNAFLRKVLANAAGAAHGMAQVEVALPREQRGKTLIGMSNLGVLTTGALLALDEFASRGYEVIVFHAVGSGGRAMELMMRQGIIGAVFDYAMGEITDELFGGVRAGGQERLTVAGDLGLPQVLCPGGAEHVGVLVDPPNSVPDRYKSHKHVFHNPVIFVPRLQSDEMLVVAREIGRRLQHTRSRAVLMLPLAGTGSYAKPGGPLHDPVSDSAFFAELRACVPATLPVIERPLHAEDPAFVREAVDRLIALIEEK
ncbi:MAG TPA: Tm-1-like ATP-binding domain-containing protein [Vicinamibacteria bacterium]|nr:Tm-1-like ATP-binding domain-containing protein [Vicinamibacteria bacterium]